MKLDRESHPDRKDVVGMYKRRVDTAKFIAPYADTTDEDLRGLLKINSDQVRPYLFGSGGLSQILLDLEAFGKTPMDFDADKVAELLDQLKQIVLMHPDDVKETIDLMVKEKGFTKSVAQLAGNLGIVDTSDKSLPAPFAVLSLVIMTTLYACGSFRYYGGHDIKDPTDADDPTSGGEAGGGGGGGGGGGDPRGNDNKPPKDDDRSG